MNYLILRNTFHLCKSIKSLTEQLWEQVGGGCSSKLLHSQLHHLEYTRDLNIYTRKSREILKGNFPAESLLILHLLGLLGNVNARLDLFLLGLIGGSI
jgi:hypothetical protein